MPFIVLAVVAAIVVRSAKPAAHPCAIRQARDRAAHVRGGQTYLAVARELAGVNPVIFAASIMAFPPTVDS